MPARRLLHPSLLAGLLLTIAVLAASGPQAQSLGIGLHDPIERVDTELRRQGWLPDGDPALESFDRELSGNDLASLRSCAGTGIGFCRYEYRRGRQRLVVITAPGGDGDGLIQQWQVSDDASDPAAGAP